MQRANATVNISSKACVLKIVMETESLHYEKMQVYIELEYASKKWQFKKTNRPA